MKKLAIIILALLSGITVQAKKTYIPRYATFISITEAGKQPVTLSNIKIENTIQSPDSMFRLSVYHDDMTLEKLKTIRRNKAAAGWYGLSASLFSLSAVMSDNAIDRFLNFVSADFAATLSAIHSANAEVANVLGISVEIDNTSNGEIMVNDMERGLSWYVLPHRTLTLRMSNPDVAQLRISDGKGNTPHYIDIGAGSVMKSMTVVYEDEDFVAVPVYGSGERSQTIEFYNIIDRRTWEQQSLSPDEYEDFKKKKTQVKHFSITSKPQLAKLGFIVMAINGKNILITSSGKAIAAGVKSCKLSVGCETIEVASATSAQFREFIAGRKEWSVSCSWLLMAKGDISVNTLKVGQTYTLQFGTTGTFVSGKAICTQCDIDANIGNLVNGSFQFKGTGELS